MNLFDRLSREALRNAPDLGALLPVVEKELLHHDILRELSAYGVLAGLTFMGGTCLRACYGSVRLSEDLDFYGGTTFRREQLDGFPGHLERVLFEKYGLEVQVKEPKPTPGHVETWKVSIITRPERSDLPVQRIHLDICALPSHDPKPMVLRNPYGVELGTTGLIVRAASREEILADKFVALALRRGRIKFRDLWDIQWLVQSAITLRSGLALEKAGQYGLRPHDFAGRLAARLRELEEDAKLPSGFLSELQRFLPVNQVRGRIDQPAYWEYLVAMLQEQARPLLKQSR
ncbi:MAG TPA: nucleotidyl transferase AbiEii/AbiGii toxin family protein [Kiritimatiellia bacterium]|nr:nucleotidyl transferase AbiEii/AbiGii toxin family protein [Kiritimatiellia bacterium]HMO99117.1 nucleotidyl transferase AbiEii/AbiGii toxin family protein [Kiritimatiellia bacterium]HMP95705.1 nucleotidyl transferase AbiEii/AbiGii toxin family protein [Kiritimatiellia bacterium]